MLSNQRYTRDINKSSNDNGKIRYSVYFGQGDTEVMWFCYKSRQWKHLFSCIRLDIRINDWSNKHWLTLYPSAFSACNLEKSGVTKSSRVLCAIRQIV